MSTDNEELILEMSKNITQRESASKYKLPIDEDTSFFIYFDIWNKEYLYFKMEENTAVSPFFYDVSYVKNDLIRIHPIFQSVDMDQAKEHLDMLFKNKKVKLHYSNEEKTEIIMEIEALWFIQKISIKFELHKNMISEEEKDDLMIKLYHINKKRKKKAKLLNNYLKEKEANYKDIIDVIKSSFDLNETNNITNNGNNNENENDNEFIDQMKSIFTNKKKALAKKCEIGYRAVIILKNKTKKTWPIGLIKFKIDKEKSKPLINDENIAYPDYEIAHKQDGEYLFIFDENAPIGEYDCFFDVFVNGNKLEGVQFELSGKIKSS